MSPNFPRKFKIWFRFSNCQNFFFKLSKFSFSNCQNFPFQTVKIFLSKLSKFAFPNCQRKCQLKRAARKTNNHSFSRHLSSQKKNRNNKKLTETVWTKKNWKNSLFGNRLDEKKLWNLLLLPFIVAGKNVRKKWNGYLLHLCLVIIGVIINYHAAFWMWIEEGFLEQGCWLEGPRVLVF
jgi:hypothetical protein